jgi:ribosomal-protein-serine acetyltransferase
MLRCALSDQAEVRLLELHHAQAAFDAVATDRAHLREWLPWVDATHTVDDTRAFIGKSLRQQADGLGMVLGIWCEGEFAGTVGCHPFDLANRRVEIGYWVASRFQGRGLVTSACRVLITYLFDEVGMHRVELRACVGNERSRKVAVRLGFQEEGVMRKAMLRLGQWDDMVIYGLLREDWQR